MLRQLSAGLMATFLLAAAARAGVTSGEPAPDFEATDSNGQTHKLSDSKGNYVVLEWTNPDCPFVKKHYSVDNMQSLQKEFVAKGVVWYSICSSAPGKQGDYTDAQWNQKTAANGAAPTAVLLDRSGQIGRLYGAKTTPHMFVIDPQGKLIYQGAIDDQPDTDAAKVAEAHNYVRAALEESMAGQPVTDPSKPSYGCGVKYE